MNTLIPGAPLRSLSPTTNEYQRAQGESRAAKPARAARFTLDAPEHSGTIPGARGDILTPGVALTSNLAVIFTLNQHRRSYQPFGRPDEIPPTCAQDSVLTYCYVSNPESSQFNSAWVNSLPSWLVQILPFDFDTRRAFAGLANTAIYVDLDGLDLSCIDGHLPPDTLYLE